MVDKKSLIYFSLSCLLAGCIATTDTEEELSNGVFEEATNNKAPKDRQIKTVHDDGHYTTLCWTEITTIKENKLNGSLQAMKEYSIIFRTPDDIPDENKEKVDYGTTKQYEIFDMDTKKSKVLNFTKVEEENNIVTSEHRQVTCGSGPVFTKTFKKSAGNKEIEIKVMPKLSSDTSLVRSLTLASPDSGWVEIENIQSVTPNNINFDENKFETEATTPFIEVGRNDNDDTIGISTKIPEVNLDFDITTPFSVVETTISDFMAREDTKQNTEASTEIPVDNFPEGKERSDAKYEMDIVAEQTDEEAQSFESNEQSAEDSYESVHYRYIPLIYPVSIYRNGPNKKQINEYLNEDYELPSSLEQYRSIPLNAKRLKSKDHKSRSQISSMSDAFKSRNPSVKIKLQPGDIEDITSMVTRTLQNEQVGIFEPYNRPISRENLCTACLPLGLGYIYEPYLKNDENAKINSMSRMYEVMGEKAVPETVTDKDNLDKMDLEDQVLESEQRTNDESKLTDNEKIQSPVVEEQDDDKIENTPRKELPLVENKSTDEETTTPQSFVTAVTDILERKILDIDNLEMEGKEKTEITSTTTEDENTDKEENENPEVTTIRIGRNIEIPIEEIESDALINEGTDNEFDDSFSESPLKLIPAEVNNIPIKDIEDDNLEENAEQDLQQHSSEEEQECQCHKKPTITSRKLTMPFKVQGRQDVPEAIRQNPKKERMTTKMLAEDNQKLNSYGAQIIPRSGRILPSYYSPLLPVTGGTTLDHRRHFWDYLPIMEPSNQHGTTRYQYLDKNYNVNPLGQLKLQPRSDFSQNTNLNKSEGFLDSLSSLLDNVMKQLN